MSREHSKLQPVILIGVDPQEAYGFDEVLLCYKGSTEILKGKFTVQMINKTLKLVFIESQEEVPQEP